MFFSLDFFFSHILSSILLNKPDAMRAHVHTSFGAFPHIFLATLILIVEVFSKFLNYGSSNEGNGAF